jgi:hypothetical protein
MANEKGFVPMAKHAKPKGARKPGRIRTAAKGIKIVPMGTWRISREINSHSFFPCILSLRRFGSNCAM